LSITQELKEKLSLADNSKGMVVVHVAKDSQATAKGVRPGDLITETAGGNEEPRRYQQKAP
jgi:S1-C subfamily serine protease